MFKKMLDMLKCELKCPICLDQFSEPVLTPCGHSFCKSCLDNLLKQTCPLCKRTLNKKGLLVNQKLKDIQSQIRQWKDDSQKSEQKTEIKDIMQHSIFKPQDQNVCNTSCISSRSSLSKDNIVQLAIKGSKYLVIVIQKEDFQKFIKIYCCKQISSGNNQFQTFTHLVVGFNEKSNLQSPTLKKKLNYLNALILGKWIVSYKWIIHSLISERILNEEDFEIEEDSYTKGTPKKSRLNGGMGDLFKNHNFIITCPAKSERVDVGITTKEIQWIINACGGNETTQCGEGVFKIQMIKSQEQHFNDNATISQSISYLWILDSVSHFEVQDYKKYII